MAPRRGTRSSDPPQTTATGFGPKLQYKANKPGPRDTQRTVKLVTEQHIVYVNTNTRKHANLPYRQTPLSQD